MDACSMKILQHFGKGKPKHTFGCHVLLLCSSAEVSAAFRQYGCHFILGSTQVANDVRFLVRTLGVVASQEELSALVQPPRWPDPFPLIPWSLRSNLQPLWTIGEFRRTAFL